MKIIIPVAGIGTRLRPHTLLAPKVLLTVAGKPILGHILDTLKNIELSEVILIVSVFPEEIKKYVAKNYSFPAKYVMQKEQLGLGHAIWLTKKFVNSEPALIIYGDTIFSADLKKAINTKLDGCIGVKSVDDPRRFGIVETKNGVVKRLIEKPEHPTSNLAIVGVNYIKNTSLLFDCLEQLMSSKKTTKGEYQLTDAFQLMIDKKAKFTTFHIEGWYDCGTVSAMLDTNKVLLTHKLPNSITPKLRNSITHKPVYIHPTAKIENSIIGPYVSIDENVYIKNSTISNSLVYSDAIIENEILSDSIIGAKTRIEGTLKKSKVKGQKSKLQLKT